MIIDTLKNAEKYFCIHPLFEETFDYLMKSVVSVKPGKTVEESISKFECHNKYIDIQICIKEELTKQAIGIVKLVK